MSSIVRNALNEYLRAAEVLHEARQMRLPPEVRTWNSN
jgi:hypothetical protein